MFKNILIPTDGSPLSEAAIRQGLALAKAINAKVTGLHVTPLFPVLAYRTDALDGFEEGFAKDSQALADRYLAVISKMAKEMGVACDTQHSISDQPYRAIIETAKEKDCDAIVMGSHGRSGLDAILLGSQAQKVLTHCQIPVMVVRAMSS